MKKISLFLLILITLFVNGLVKAASWSYEWENVVVEIPLYESLNSYDDLPKATLYKDGTLVSDAKISYNRNGDWLYYAKDVDTSKVGDYKVWYKASESRYKPGHCQNYKQLITFRVIDETAPSINILKDKIIIPLGTKEMNYNEYFTIRDNSSEVIINVDDSKVDYNKIGTYDVLIEAIDISGNKCTKHLEVLIQDENGPVINFLGENNTITIEKNSDIILDDYFKQYFKVIDKIDGDVINSMEYDKIDINVVANNKISFYFKDSSGNISSIDINVNVIDELAPSLILSTDNLKLDYLTEPSYELFKTYIVEAKDGIIDLIDEVKIDFSAIELKVGSYIVKYSVSDASGNEVEKDLLVNYVTNKAPELLVEDVVINVGEEVNLKDYVQVSDKSDLNVENNIEIDTTKFNNKAAGIYYLNVTCHNSSNLFSNAYMKVEVIDNEKDVTNYLNIILIGLLVLGSCGFIVYKIITKRRNKITN